MLMDFQRKLRFNYYLKKSHSQLLDPVRLFPVELRQVCGLYKPATNIQILHIIWILVDTNLNCFYPASSQQIRTKTRKKSLPSAMEKITKKYNSPKRKPQGTFRITPLKFISKTNSKVVLQTIHSAF